MGFAGSLVVIALFVGLFLRVIYLSDDTKQSSVEFMAIALLVFYLPISL
jgi:cell division protein FtsW (lipid II flippase)